MKGLLLKESLVMIKNNKASLLIIPIFAVIGIINKQMMFILLIPVLLAMLPLGTMTYDEISRWNFYVQCMPVEKKRIVSSKYLTVVILALAGAFIVGCIKLIYDIAAGETDHRVIIMMIITAFTLGLLVPCISIPLNLKFGTAKGRIFYLIFTGIICGVLPSMFLSDDKNFTVKLAKLTSHFAVFSIISVAAVLVLLAVSWTIYSMIYEHKEI